MKNEIILYQSNELSEHIEVRIDDEKETIWLTQKQMGVLFGKDTDTIGLHLKNIYTEEELKENSTTELFSVVQKEGKRNVSRNIKFYNLDAILSVGYRVNSKRGTQFRQWASQRLKDYLLKGYALNNRMNRVEDNIRFAQKSIVLIDNYIDENTLTHLAKKDNGVKVLLLTKTISKSLQLDLQKANEQYGNFVAKPFAYSHDRFLIIDSKEVYHLGASLKDLGKKWFAFSKLEKTSVQSIMNSILESK